jgi:hypothetical protein
VYIDECDESVVLNKISEITKHTKELGSKIGEFEFKNKEEEHGDDHQSNKGKGKRERR